MDSTQNISSTELTLQDLRSLGGKTRAKTLTPERRKEIAIKANAAKKCNQGRPKATHVGDLGLGEIKVSCAVLEDGTRVITQRSMQELLGRNKTGSFKRDAQVNPFISANNLTPFIPSDLSVASTMIEFVHPSAGKAYGYKAEIIPQICKVYLDARRAGKLLSNQEHIAKQAEIIIQALASVGITALIDEATGFQYDREHDALQKALAMFIAKELQPWTRKFPIEFFHNVKRIYGLDVNNPKIPQFVGHFINKHIYKELNPEILEELKKINPMNENGTGRRHKHHQWLTKDLGCPALEKQIVKINTLMSISHTKEEFEDFLLKSKGQEQYKLL